VTLVRLGKLGPGPKVRSHWISHDHVARLAERGDVDSWPPIIVRDVLGKLVILDGQHRKAAADQLGLAEIEAEVIRCSDAEALEIAARSNLTHGLPLTRPERQAAARRLIRDTDWSDRRIAEACGLSHPHVADLRPSTVVDTSGIPDAGESTIVDTERSTGPGYQLNTREGADGRRRPATAHAAEANRRRAAELAEQNPEMPTRELAEKAGVSVGTAHKVRSDPRPHLHAVPAAEPEPEEARVKDVLPTIPENWTHHPAATRSDEARSFFQWLNGWVRPSKFQAKAEVMAATCPPDAAEDVARGARWMADQLQNFATQVEQRRSLEVAR
jgi:ParB-like chromosome segregation protein Spo0J